MGEQPHLPIQTWARFASGEVNPRFVLKVLDGATEPTAPDERGQMIERMLIKHLGIASVTQRSAARTAAEIFLATEAAMDDNFVNANFPLSTGHTEAARVA
jgi:hypothetical protein